MSQRTKGNVKPSSSERASRLLSSNQNRILSFSEASKCLSSVYVPEPSDSNVSAFNCDIDLDFQNVFKHMSKKSIQTKTKALNDFMDLCTKKSTEQLVNVSRYWFRIYKKLANAIESDIRKLAHEAQLKFLTIDKDSLVPCLVETNLSLNETKFETNQDVSFQSLVTMPAVIWLSSFDPSRRSEMVAQDLLKQILAHKNFENFFNDYCESILNYILYFIFQKIPVNLFYQTTLDNDLLREFEDYQITICFKGFAAIIRKLFEQDSNDPNIEKIFLRLNSEFVKGKGLDDVSKNQQLDTEQEQQVKNDLNDGDQFIKKKKNKAKKETMKIEKKKYDFWQYFKSPNSSVRSAAMDMLSTLTRMTTYFVSDKDFLQRTNISNRLWFKLYKSNLMDVVFKVLFDDVDVNVRGKAWLLASHLLINQNIYKPGLVINWDEWLQKTMKPFLNNGLKPASGNALRGFGDFLVNENYVTDIWYEGLNKSMSNIYFSAYKMIFQHYKSENIEQNLNIIMVFIEAFMKQSSSKDIYKTLEFFLNNVFEKTSNEIYFKTLFVELYFNICSLAIYHCLKRCDPKEEQIAKDVIKRITKQLHHLLKKTIGDPETDKPDKTIVYLNHLLLMHKSKQFTSTFESTGELNNDLSNSFESNMIFAYQDILSTFTANPLGVIRFLTESYYDPNDQYFSYDYHIKPNNLNYERNLSKLYIEYRKNNEDEENKLIIFWHFLPVNESYKNQYSKVKLSLYNLVPCSFTKTTIQTIIELIKLINSSLNDFKLENLQKTYIMMAHLQYILRAFNEEQLVKIIDVEKHLINWMNQAYTLCKNTFNKCDKWIIPIKLITFICEKILDIYWTILLKTSNKNWQKRLEEFLSKLKLCPFMISIQYVKLLLQQESILPENYKQLIELHYNYVIKRSICQTEIYEKVLGTQVEMALEPIKGSEGNQDLELPILLNLLSYYIDVPEILINDQTIIKMIWNLTHVLLLRFGSNYNTSEKTITILLKLTKFLQLMNRSIFFNPKIHKTFSRDFKDKFNEQMNILIEKYYYCNCKCVENFQDYLNNIYKLLFNQFHEFNEEISQIWKAIFKLISKEIFRKNFEENKFGTTQNRNLFIKNMLSHLINLHQECCSLNDIHHPIPFLHNDLMYEIQKEYAKIEIIDLQQSFELVNILYFDQKKQSINQLIKLNELSDRKSTIDRMLEWIVDPNKFQMACQNMWELLEITLSITAIMDSLINNIVHKEEDNNLHDSNYFVLMRQLFQNYYLFENFSSILKDYKKIKSLSEGFSFTMFKKMFQTYHEEWKMQFEKLYYSSFFIDFENSNSDSKWDYLWMLSQTTSNEVNLKNLSLFINILDFHHFQLKDFAQQAKNAGNILNDLGGIGLLFTQDVDFILETATICNLNFKLESMEIINDDQMTEKVELVKNSLLTLMITAIHLDQLKPIEEEQSKRFVDIIKQAFSKESLLVNLLVNMDQFPNIKDVSNYQICWMASMFMEISFKFILKHFEREVLEIYITIYKHWCRNIYTLPKQVTFETIMLLSTILQSLYYFIDNSRTLEEKEVEVKTEVEAEVPEAETTISTNELLKIFEAYQSLNILLPFFVTFTDIFEDNLHRPFFRQLSSIMLLINNECLKDISLLEDNQILLKYNKDSLSEQNMRSLLLDLEESSEPNNYLQTGRNSFYNYILEHVTPLLLKDNYMTIFCAYHLISTTIDSIEWRSDSEITSNDANADDLTLSKLNSCGDKNQKMPPKFLVCLLLNLNKSISINDFNSKAAFAYLLIWAIYFRLLQCFPYSETRQDLINFIWENDLHLKLFQNLFFLMNIDLYNPSDFKLDDFKEIFQTIKSKNTVNHEDIEKEIFAKLDSLQDSRKLLELMNDVDEHMVARMATFVYFQSLTYIPKLLRSWFKNLKQTQKQVVTNITQSFFSHLLIIKEVKIIEQADKSKFGDIRIKTTVKKSNISATYFFKDIKVEIEFNFDVNYPLTPVTIELTTSNQRTFTGDEHRKWLQALNILICSMNCPILEGIIIFKKNMDKFFEDVEECMICLFVMYGTTGQFPKFRCPQCKKKFHTACIRKWFQTAQQNNNTCPQCKFEFY